MDERAQRVEVRRGVQPGDVVLMGAAQEIPPGTPVKLAPAVQQARGEAGPGAMTISDFAIKRPIITVVSMLILVIFGIFALVNLEVDEFPDLTNPIVFVAVPYPGASPSQVEREVVERMEEAFSALSGVDEITSTSLDGFAQIIVQFEFSKDPDQATQDVRDAISGIRADLPLEMEEPILRRFDPADFPIVSLVLSSQTHESRRADAAGRPRHHPRAAGDQRRGPGDRGGRRRAGDLRQRAARRPPGRGGHRGPGGAGGSVPEPGGARGPGRGATSPSRPSACAAGSRRPRSSRSSWSARRRPARPPRPGGRRHATARPSQRSLALYNGEDAVGIDITKSKGASTTSVADAGAGPRRAHPEDPSPGGRDGRGAQLRASGSATRCATSRRR